MGEEDKNIIEENEVQGAEVQEETVVQETEVTEEATVQEEAPAEPEAEEPTAEEPVAEEPAVEEPEAEDPVAEAPKEPEEKDLKAQMDDYLRQVCAAVIPKGSNENELEAQQEQQRALTDQLHVAIQEITHTEVGIDSLEADVLLSDLRVYDKKADRFVMLSELSDPPAFLTKDSKVSFDLVSKMLMEEYSFFLPKWKDDGQMDMEDPIIIGGGFVDGNFYLKVDDAARASEYEKLQAPLQKPGFLDRVVDFSGFTLSPV